MTTTDALQQMARHVATQLVADALKGMVGTPITVTVHASTPEPRLLLPAKKTRKVWPKTAARKPSGRKPWTAAQHAKFAKTMAARRGTPVPAVPRKVGRPRKLTVEARCSRCDHTHGEHDPETSKCLSFRCVCTEFWP